MNKIEKYKELISRLEKKEYSFDQEIIKPHCLDWRKSYRGTSELIIFPKNTKKLAEVVKFCFKKNISIVPQGGNTGLVGGSVPRKNKSEIIINLKNLNKIRKFNPLSYSIIVESGCILESIQSFVLKNNLVFPISMGSRGTCQIGGNIATNAGGINVIKYGLLRENIIGLEAVLSDGSILSELMDIKKNNTGYDLKQLLIGSEGTLAIITAANVKLYPKPKDKKILFANFTDIKRLLEFYNSIIRVFSDSVTAFEMIDKNSMEIVLKNNSQLKRVLTKNSYYCLVELSNFINIENFNDFILKNLDKINSSFNDLIVTKSETENQKLWEYRELIPLAENKEGFCIKHDVSIPLDNMAKFIKQTSLEIKRINKNFDIINFGHIGDNNLHFNVFNKKEPQSNYLSKNKKIINNIIFKNAKLYNGSFSAEHGIGQLKKKELRKFKNKNSIDKMLRIKKIFDPKNIFNPGKVF